ncbi:MAG: imidazole glycerol phosphate synthase subunit HisH [Hyphomicrobiaceae bacterium]
MIAVVDYGSGNVRAIVNIYKRLNIPVTLANDAQGLADAERIVLPGVGSFDWAMQRLEQSGLRQALVDAVTIAKRPILGICVGMQMMARSSDEGEQAGLGWIDAEVKRFPHNPQGDPLILPHMGWNTIELQRQSPLLTGLENNSRFYFLHSYHFLQRTNDVVLAKTNYGGRFTCAIEEGNCYGVQFHPEKSHGWGIRLLKNFAEV